MENLRGRGRLADLDVVVGAKLQEPLDARRRVLRTLALVTVRQHHGQAGIAAPLGFGRHDELIDPDLRTVDEIAELGLPDRERVGLCARITVLEGQHGLFGEHRIDDGERCLALADVLQGDVGAVVPALAVLVVQHGVAVCEGASARILARNAHAIARDQQRG